MYGRDDFGFREREGTGIGGATHETCEQNVSLVERGWETARSSRPYPKFVIRTNAARGNQNHRASDGLHF